MKTFAPKLLIGDAIGIICPSHVPDPARHKRSIAVLKSLGFEVKLGENVYKDTYGYTASAEERTADFNAMVADDTVKIPIGSNVKFNADARTLEFMDYHDNT